MTYDEVNPSPKRLEWLRMLAADGPAECPFRGTVGHGCRRAGWSTWVWTRGHERATREQIEAHYGIPGAWSRATADGWKITQKETITDRGRALLAELDAAQ